MAIMDIKLTGEHWFDFNVDTVEAVELEIEAIAAFVGQSVDVFAAAAIHQVCSGRVAEGQAAKAQMLGIVAYLLALDTGEPNHPGKYRDYMAARHLTFDILPEPDGAVVHVTGFTKFAS